VRVLYSLLPSIASISDLHRHDRDREMDIAGRSDRGEVDVGLMEAKVRNEIGGLCCERGREGGRGRGRGRGRWWVSIR